MVGDVMVGDMMVGDMGYAGDMGYLGFEEGMTGAVQEVPLVDKLMSSWIFVGGVTAAFLALGILFGFLAAKQKIKKGIDLYED